MSPKLAGLVTTASVTSLSLVTVACQPSRSQDAATEVRSAETAFAATMADRDIVSFATFIADEAVFFGDGEVLRGADAITDGWRAFFETPEAPFSWEPQSVEVLDSGRLALSSGPVYNSDRAVVGSFNSVWRLESDGRWRVIFDKGCPPCDCDSEPSPASVDQER